MRMGSPVGRFEVGAWQQRLYQRHLTLHAYERHSRLTGAHQNWPRRAQTYAPQDAPTNSTTCPKRGLPSEHGAKATNTPTSAFQHGRREGAQDDERRSQRQSEVSAVLER